MPKSEKRFLRNSNTVSDGQCRGCDVRFETIKESFGRGGSEVRVRWDAGGLREVRRPERGCRDGEELQKGRR